MRPRERRLALFRALRRTRQIGLAEFVNHLRGGP
jgi:hypothetical protein